MTVRILQGDVRAVLPTLPDCSVQMVVTSPPYWALRSYLPADHPDKALEIGSEPTVYEWVDVMVQVFREVRRVLRDDGVLFLNLGDSYSTGTSAGRQDSATADHGGWAAVARMGGRRANVPGLKAKDLIGQPWMVAFALRADGWWLRQEIIWEKPGPMPESVTDRCTKAHEHVFLLTKSANYFWNFDAVQEPVTGGAHARGPGNKTHGKYADSLGRDGEHRTKSGLVAYAERQRAKKAGVNPKATDAADGVRANESWAEKMDAAETVSTRNPRSVWRIASEPFKGAHYATYPSEMARRCILAGSKAGDTVLDPFGGSGTTGLAADQLQRHAILIDLDARNAPMARQRIEGDSALFAEVVA